MNNVEKIHPDRALRAKKMMLVFALISIIMLFAGLTSAYLVSQSRPDWLRGFQLPPAFFTSTLILLASSLTFYLATKSIKKEKPGTGMAFLCSTLFLGVAFVFFQFRGFSEIIQNGYYFTGSQSNITSSFLYVLVVTHLAHLFSGLLVLLVVIYNHSKKKYQPARTLGLEMAAIYWHFLDLLWLYLVVFFYFTK